MPSISRTAIVLCLLLAPGCAPTEPSPPTVVEVVDGDTLIVSIRGRTEPLRLLGIDTPESVDPNRPVQCFGPEASKRLADLLPVGTPLRVERDVEGRDRYGRLLGYVHRESDGLFVNEAMLREGYADLLVFEPNTTRSAELEAAATAARTADRGLWGVCGGPDVAIDPPPPSA